MVIEPFAATGDAPSWIHGHGAKLADDGKTIVVSGGELRHGSDRTMAENIDTWSLNVATAAWERMRVLDWQRWTMLRKQSGWTAFEWEMESS